MTRVLLPFLLATSLLAQPEIRLGSERPVGDFRQGPWPSNAQSVVAEGDGYVAFWFAEDLMASRLTAEGTTIGAPLSVLAQRRAHRVAAVRTDANRYLVAYSGTE